MRALSITLLLLCSTTQSVYAAATTVIQTCNDLQNISLDLTGTYSLNSSIDCSKQNFSVIGSSSQPFTGNLIGNGFSINNLQINAQNSDNVGLFSAVNNASIVNLNFGGAVINGRNQVGILAGQANNTLIQNILITNSPNPGRSSKVHGTNNVGGLLGMAQTVSIDNVYFLGGIVDAPTGTSVGGLVGQIQDSVINIIGMDTAVRGKNNVGGLAGQAQGILTSNTLTDTKYAHDTSETIPYGITGVQAVGRLIGSLNVSATPGYQRNSINQAYSIQRMNRPSGNNTFTQVGGLIGFADSLDIYDSATIIAPDSTPTNMLNGNLIGEVRNVKLIRTYADGPFRGLVGKSLNSQTTFAYWLDHGSSSDSLNLGGAPLTAAQMSVKTNLQTWDFNSTWCMTNDRYPQQISAPQFALVQSLGLRIPL